MPRFVPTSGYQLCNEHVRSVVRCGHENPSKSLRADCDHILAHGPAPHRRLYNFEGRDEGYEMHLWVRTVGGNNDFQFVTAHETTVFMLHAHVALELSVPESQLRLIWQGFQWNVDEYGGHFLAEVGLEEGSVVHAVLVLPGGCFRCSLNSEVSLNLSPNAPYRMPYSSGFDVFVDFTRGRAALASRLSAYNGMYKERVQSMSSTTVPSFIATTKRTLNVRVYCIPPVFVRRDSDGSIHKWHSRAVLSAAHVLSRAHLPRELFAVVFAFLELTPDKYEEPSFEMKMTRQLVESREGSDCFLVHFDFDESDPPTKAVMDAPSSHLRVDINTDVYVPYVSNRRSHLHTFPYISNQFAYQTIDNYVLSETHECPFKHSFHIYPQSEWPTEDEEDEFASQRQVKYYTGYVIAY